MKACMDERARYIETNNFMLLVSLDWRRQKNLGENRGLPEVLNKQSKAANNSAPRASITIPNLTCWL